MRTLTTQSIFAVSPCTYCSNECICLDASAAQLGEKSRYASCLPVHGGSVVFRKGSVARHVYGICKGLVKLVDDLPNGRPRILRLLREGEIAGLEGLVDDTYHASAIAINDVRACVIPIKQIKQWDREVPHFHQFMLKQWLRSLDQAGSVITQMSTGTAETRVARLLLHLLRYQSTGSNCHCHTISREDMGALLGLTKETASRTIAALKRRGLIGIELGQSFTCNQVELEIL